MSMRNWKITNEDGSTNVAVSSKNLWGDTAEDLGPVVKTPYQSGPPTKSAYDIYDSFTSAERIAIRNSGNDMIDDFVDHLDKAINAGVTLDMSDGSKTAVALEGLEAAGLLTEDRVAAIKSL